jgi:Ca-activated chloride channel homolog
MRRRRRTVLVLGLALTLPFGSFAEACTPANSAVLLMLDASYSMLRLVSGGVSRFSAARSAVNATVDVFPDEGLLALRIYGSQSQVIRDDCTDSVLAVPFAAAKDNRDKIKLALGQTHARGVTPIAYSLQLAAGDFTNDKIQRTIILVSDGAESCNGDPCSVAEQMAGNGFVINVIGLMTTGLARASLRCIASATGGAYFDVPVAAQLSDKLREALQDCPVAALPPRAYRTRMPT